MHFPMDLGTHGKRVFHAQWVITHRLRTTVIEASDLGVIGLLAVTKNTHGGGGEQACKSKEIEQTRDQFKDEDEQDL